MPVFVEDPSQFSKQRLKLALISHNVELPPEESKKQVYMDLYMKHIWNQSNADFSSDEEDQTQSSTEEEIREENNMMDLSLLTDDQLKKKLLQYGVKPGPIVASTRALYERKLQRLEHSSQFKVNGTCTCDTAKYSDSEEEEEEEEEENEEESGSEELRPESVSHTETSATGSTVGRYSQSKELFYPQCFYPALRQGKKQQRSLDSSRSISKSFSITQLVEEIENKLSPQSQLGETAKTCNQTPVENRVQWDLQRLNKNTMTNTSLYLTPKYSHHQKETTTIKSTPEPMTDILMDLFPDAATTPTGIMATKRRPIKGAAGRPVQFKYPETPLSPATLEKREIQRRLVPLWVQIIVFLLVTALLYFIYISMEDQLENPFSALLDSLSEETVTEEVSLIPSCSQDVHTSEVAAQEQAVF
ncbi:LEM domain-containing protein 1 isoform X2 [Hoplias malabaricus]|uniref:LEM domain-containing protein 1 isoform X2 n=1 Tax=Hoplias malabaricus TaxID=27720 RepID=UPI003462B8DB